jgi:hypothetical protein
VLNPAGHGFEQSALRHPRIVVCHAVAGRPICHGSLELSLVEKPLIA